jgi:hypothetical protein
VRELRRCNVHGREREHGQLSGGGADDHDDDDAQTMERSYGGDCMVGHTGLGNVVHGRGRRHHAIEDDDTRRPA